ncbi:MAG: LamG protein [Mucilaginibacter sp.]|nr:LamG protein [Mucilaginibacter sp.]
MKILTTCFLIITGSVSLAQQKQKTHDYTTIKSTEWTLPDTGGLGYSFDTYQGSKALLLKKDFDNYKFGTVAYPKGLNFEDGEIELDMASTTGKDYLGLAFHIKDAHHYETLYFRPAASGTINAVQYMPEKKEDFNWWDYQANKYQAKAMLPSTALVSCKSSCKRPAAYRICRSSA